MKHIALLLMLFAAPAAAEAPIQLYTLDCGHGSFADGGLATDTGELDGKPIEMANPCFLIVHPKGTLLWDAGLPPEKRTATGFEAVPGAPLKEQLHALPEPTLLAFSHLHFDHVGQSSAFTQATWILNRCELAYAEASPAHFGIDPSLLQKRGPTQLIDGDHDVFGDGRVRILHLPGHTPGSQALVVKLAKQTVMLSGDLYMFRESRTGWVPTINADRAQTRASQERFERIARRLHARVIVQHDPRDYADLPKPPRRLE